MTVGMAKTSRKFSNPYLTLAEYKQAPTAIDYNNLVAGSTDPAVQDAELTNAIARASSWIDEYCGQVLGATRDTETLRGRMSSDGNIRIHPRYSPIVALEAFAYGLQPTQMVSLSDCSVAWIEDSSVIVPWASNSISSQGPLQFGLPSAPTARIYCAITYVNGYASTLLASNALAGATSIVVADATGLLAGMSVTIYDGLSTETVEIDSSYVYGSTTVPLVADLLYAHSSGIAVSALPPSIKQAAILATTGFLKVRGDNAMVMQVTNLPSQATGGEQRDDSDFAKAEKLLRNFRRIR